MTLEIRLRPAVPQTSPCLFSRLKKFTSSRLAMIFRQLSILTILRGLVTFSVASALGCIGLIPMYKHVATEPPLLDALCWMGAASFLASGVAMLPLAGATLETVFRRWLMSMGLRVGVCGFACVLLLIFGCDRQSVGLAGIYWYSIHLAAEVVWFRKRLTGSEMAMIDQEGSTLRC